MIRDKMPELSKNKSKSFVWRNHEILRIEAFSDAVFAFAITLTIVSLEVPISFHELIESMKGMIGFAICFMFLILIWHRQYLFFRHFGLRDLTTIVLNSVLIFVVLFYVYPLKFMFTLLTSSNQVMENGKMINRVESYDDIRSLMVIYSLGLIAVYLTFCLMYFHAWRKRAQLHLSKIEVFNLKTSIYNDSGLISVGILCILFSVFLPGEYAPSAGMVFMLIWPVISVIVFFRRKSLQKIISAEELHNHHEAVAKSKRSHHPQGHMD